MPDAITIHPPIGWDQITGHLLLDGHHDFRTVLRLVGPTMREADGVTCDEPFTPGPVDEVRVAAWPVGEAEIRQAREEMQRLVDQFPDRTFGGELQLNETGRAMVEKWRRLTVCYTAGPDGAPVPQAVLIRPCVTWVLVEEGGCGA